MNKFANNAGFAYNVGIAAGNLFDFIVSRQQAAKQNLSYQKGEDMLIYNLQRQNRLDQPMNPMWKYYWNQPRSTGTWANRKRNK